MKATVAVLILSVFLGASILAVTAEQARAESLRCGTKIVEVGENTGTLLASCGPPTYRVIAKYAGGESWYYDRGSVQFTKKVVTLGGKIIAIEDGEYGWTAPASPQM